MPTAEQWRLVNELNLQSKPRRELAQGAVWLSLEAMDKVRMQFRRIRADVSEWHGITYDDNSIGTPDWYRNRTEWTTALNSLYGDIHFLLISLRHLDLSFRMLRRHLPQELELEAVRAKHNEFLKGVGGLRNHLEHIDERLEAGVSNYGSVNIDGTSFEFDNDRIEIGPEQEARVEEFFRDLLTACRAIADRQREGTVGGKP